MKNILNKYFFASVITSLVTCSVIGQDYLDPKCSFDTLASGMITRICCHQNDVIKSILHYRDGYAEGEYVYYDSLGRLTMRCFYLHEKMVGESIMNDFEHGIFCTSQNNIDGSQHSICRYESGRKMEESFSMNGVISGLYLRWHQNGRLSLRMHQDEGASRYCVFFDNGKISIKGKIFNSPFAKIGRWVTKDVHGNRISIEHFSKKEPNVKSGTFKYYEDGKLIRVEKYVNDVLMDK